MQIRTAPLIDPVVTGLSCLALAMALVACGPSEQTVRPQQSSTDAASKAPQSSDPSFFGRLFGANHPHPSLPEARMITRETACAPYLGNDDGMAEAVVPAATDDLWQRLRDGMQLDHSVNDPRVQKEIAFYARNQRLLNHIAQQASLYLYFVLDELEQRNMPLELALIPAMESTYNPLARSPGGAIGMWQFMPGTARVYGLHTDNNFDERRDVVESTRAALDYLTRLDRKLGGGWLNAVASYNTGELNIIAAMRRNERQGKSTDYWQLQLRAPTSHYVPRLIALSKVLANPERYGIELMPIENSPVFATVTMDSRINLVQAANTAGISTPQLFALNPGLNRNALPRGAYTLHVPVGKRAEFQRALAAATPQTYTTQLASAQNGSRYTIQRGDSLGAIAKRFGTSIDNLRAANGIKGNTIRAGQTLTIPGSDRIATAAFVPPALVSPSPTASAPAKQTYTVKDGDTLWRIARELNVSSRALAKWNGLSSDNLRAGQKLTLHVEP